MKSHEVSSKKFVTSVTVSEVLVSAGIQMLQVANDIAFTDAAYGEEWAFETANRLATLSEVLNLVYKRLDVQALSASIDLPAGVVGERKLNPRYVPEAEEPSSKDEGSTDGSGGLQNSISDLPF